VAVTFTNAGLNAATDGDPTTIDTTGPTVVSVTPSGVVGSEVSQIEVVFGDTNGLWETTVTDAGNYTLLASGGDGTFGDGNEVDVSAGITGISYDAPTKTATVSISPALGDEAYKLTISGTGTVRDTAGNALNDGADEVTTFTVDSESPTEWVWDDGDAGYAETGSGWAQGYAAGSYNGDCRWTWNSGGADTAEWTFEGLETGNYEVYVTWPESTVRATNAPYAVYDDATGEGGALINQKVAPDDAEHDGQWWESLGVFSIESGTLVVELSDDANGIVVADAVLVLKVDAAPTEWAWDDGDAGYAETGTGWSQGYAAGSYNGDCRWTWNSGYEVFVTWAASSVRATNAPYAVYDDATGEGGALINQKVAPDDAEHDGQWWESLGVYSIESGTLVVALSDDANGIVIADAVWVEKVETAPTEWVSDDGDAGYGETGTGWNAASKAGAYDGDCRWHVKGSGANTAEWTFGGLDAGNYEVTVTWPESTVRATNAPYAVYDGATVVGGALINQQLAATDEEFGGVWWKNLGTFGIESVTIVVKLTDDANGIVVADAVRVVKVDEAPTEWIQDNLDGGYVETGVGWYTGYKTAAYNGECRWHLAGSGTNKASWTFSGLETGSYQVFATWTSSSNRATDAPFTILDGAAAEATVDMNQQAGPNDEEASGVWWESLGTFSIDSGILTVELTDDANGIVIADAIRVVRV